ncbi:MAG: Kazal domain-containing protein [Methylocystis sp.]|nr:MAG: Kazal domain-containing protein [Methylocystis sp.]
MAMHFGLRLCALLASTLFLFFMATSSPAVAAGGLGAKCGGFVGLPCAKGLWCEMRPGSCRVADAFGHCARKPAFCRRNFRPVCGCDGRTYPNDCARRAAGVSKNHNGRCRRHH